MNKLALVLFLAACGGSSDYKTDVVNGMHDSIEVDLQALIDSAKALQTAAPDHAWDATADADAIARMTAAWRSARIAYEHVEGATAPIFPDEDVSMDERYDGFLASLGPDGDPNLFDDQGVTGMHAIERILFAPAIREEVTEFEAQLPGYTPAAWPATAQEATDFKTKLCQRLVDDAQKLHDEWTPANIDVGAAFQGLVGLMNEQKEKVNLAATGEEESRYANWTLFDLRNNLAGTRAIYTIFQPWVQSKGGDEDARIERGFGTLDALYRTSSGDALPPVPETWSSDNPSPSDLGTPFGMMWAGVHEAVDPTLDGSIVFEMNEAAVKLGFPEFVEQ